MANKRTDDDDDVKLSYGVDRKKPKGTCTIHILLWNHLVQRSFKLSVSCLILRVRPLGQLADKQTATSNFCEWYECFNLL